MKNKKSSRDRFKHTKDYKVEIALGLITILILSGMGVMSVTRTITDTSDTIDTYIRNSNGKYWEATEANLISAIADITGKGWVEIPNMITITDTLIVKSGLTLRGRGDGTGLYLADGSNCAMIQNTNWDDWTGTPTFYADENINIENMVLDQNDPNQAVYTNVGNYALCYHAIRLFDVRNVTISNCIFRDIVADGVDVNVGSNIHVDDNEFYNVGLGFDDGTATEVTTRCAYFFFGDNVSFNRNICKNLHCSAVSIEPYGAKKFSVIENFQILDNFIDGCWNGVWIEGHGSSDKESVRNGIISGNVITNVTNDKGYKLTNIGMCNAIGTVRFTYDITISNNIINYGGNFTDSTKGKGIWSYGENITIANNEITDIGGYGIVANMSSTVIGNTITDCTNYGIYMVIPTADCDINVMSPDVSDNRIVDTVGGIQFKESVSTSIDTTMKSGICSRNTILGCDKTGGEYIDGIYVKIYNLTVSENEIHGGQFGLKLEGSWCDISNNKIYDSNDFGIKAYRSGGIKYCKFIGNSINECTDSGMALWDVLYSSFNSNIITQCDEGIDELTDSTGCDYNIYLGNIVKDCSGDDYDINGANCLPASGDRANFNIGTFA